MFTDLDRYDRAQSGMRVRALWFRIVAVGQMQVGAQPDADSGVWSGSGAPF